MGFQITKASNIEIETNGVTEVMNQEIRGEGTIVWNEFEGGFFGIQSKNGTKYYPIKSLDKDLKVNGTVVKFVLKPQTGVVTTVMWGIPVSVISIEKIGS